MNYYCYILKNEDNNRTYVGFTVDLNRRLKQHNNILKGGAKYTKISNTWTIYAYITGFPDKINALQCEWRLKHPINKFSSSYSGVYGRIKALNYILKLDKWTSKSVVLNKNINLQIYINKEYVNYIDNPNDNYVVNIIE